MDFICKSGPGILKIQPFLPMRLGSKFCTLLHHYILHFSGLQFYFSVAHLVYIEIGPVKKVKNRLI